MTVELLEWVDPDGAATTLIKTRGATGRWMPPVAQIDEPVPGDDGSRFRSVRYLANQVVVPILLDGTDRADYRGRIRALARTLDPKRGEGRLRATLDTEVRELQCRYLDGMGVAEEFPLHAIPSLLFRAVDPFWRDADDTTAVITRPDSVNSWFPLLPIQLNSSSVYASMTITNDGDVDAWPVWTITGPGTDLTLSNDTTGRVLHLTSPLATGDTVTIDTRPSYKTVLDGDGTNLFPTLTRGSSLWPLASGGNDITISFTGAAGQPSSSVTLAYRRRWLGA